VAKHGVDKFCKAANKVWHKDLKDAKTFYMKVAALNIMVLLNPNSGGLHAIDMISLRTKWRNIMCRQTASPNTL
jgi:hypothetical protein